MTKTSFADVVTELNDACMALRAFTLGRNGASQRGGKISIQRIHSKCKRLEKLFATGPHAATMEHLVASARTRVLAAETRLALLQKK
jgi:hypothetical protein